MRKFFCAVMLATLCSVPAFAQQQPAAKGPQNEAINTGNRAATEPVKGANSFTEGQARERIAANGFTNVGKLTKDADGIWRGTAMRAGQSVAVALDYTGTVFPRNETGSAVR